MLLKLPAAADGNENGRVGRSNSFWVNEDGAALVAVVVAKTVGVTQTDAGRLDGFGVEVFVDACEFKVVRLDFVVVLPRSCSFCC